GTLQVIGVNVYESSEPSPLVADLDDAILRVDPAVEAEAKAQLQAHKDARDSKAAQAAIDALKAAAASDQNLVPASITAAKAGVTTGEWAGALREVFGEYRAPTGVEGSIAQGDESIFAEIRLRLDALTKRLGRRPKMLVAKPGLDGHSNGAEQIAIAAMASGFDVVYDGIRLSPERIADSALEEGVHLVGLSVLSGSHLDLSGEVLKALRKRGVSAPVVVGGIIPDADARELKSLGIERVYTPKDYSTQAIFDDLVQLLETGAESA
ncbi:MAG: methylmalonyl-CoA mutase family protein, partial [Myxococcota bacterium]